MPGPTRFPGSSDDTSSSSMGNNMNKDSTMGRGSDRSSDTDDMARSASEMAQNVSQKLKSVGVDTDVMVGAAKEHVSDLQRLIGQELQHRPYRALGIAAAFGAFVGLMMSR